MLNVKQICNSVIDFWFEGVRETSIVSPKLMKMWFGGSTPEADERIRNEYIPLSETLNKEPLLLEELCSTALGAVAAIVLFDQFPRNAFRLDPRSFSFDGRALELSKKFILRNDRIDLHPIIQVFAYLPFEHSESIEDQIQGLKLFEQLSNRTNDAVTKPMLDDFLDYAKRHKDIIERFGRFPHRNDILGRKSTPEEDEFLKSGGETFGTKRV